MTFIILIAIKKQKDLITSHLKAREESEKTVALKSRTK